jgi:hypothetical protein
VQSSFDLVLSPNPTLSRYFHSTNNYYSAAAVSAHQAVSVCGTTAAVDLYLNDGPATMLNGSAYEERLFGARVGDLHNS